VTDITRDRARLRDLLAGARRIAVVGASPNPTRDSHRISQYLIHQGYDVVPVNPAQEEILGRRCFPTVRDVPGTVDIVDIFRRPEHAAEVVDDAIAAGAKSVWFQLDTLNEEAAARAAAAGLAVVKDACIMVVHQVLRIPPKGGR
jgi:hypothetical protein